MRTPPLLRRLAGGVARWHGIVGLNYHRIGDGRRSVFDRGLWSATEEDFDAQVRYLKANFDIISPRDVHYVLRVKRGRHVILTFDDGYADNYTAAFPILRANGAQASFFVATGFIDEPHLPWWDEIAWMLRTSKKTVLDLRPFLPAPVTFDEPERERAVRTVLRGYKALPTVQTGGYLVAIAVATGTGRASAEVLDVRSLWMTWDMLREMHAGGMTIGGHTVSHPVLSRLTRDEQVREITTSARRIREEIGTSVRAFAYPVGSRDAFDDVSRETLRSLGVTTAFSYYGGARKLGEWDDLDIRRIAIEQDTTMSEFRAILMLPRAA